MAKQATGLQVEEDRPWQERFWTAQRVAWALMALLVLAALLGATGRGGLIASASARSAGATVEYPRISRWQSDEQLVVRLPASAAGEVGVELSKAFTERFMVESVQPQPSQVEAAGTGRRYSFDVAPGGGEKTIVFMVRSDHPFFERSVEARIGDAPPTAMTMTVLP